MYIQKFFRGPYRLGGMTVKKTGKSTFFIVVIFIALFAVSSIFGVDKLFADKRTTLIKASMISALVSTSRAVLTLLSLPRRAMMPQRHSSTRLPKLSRQDFLLLVSPIMRSTATKKATESSFVSHGRSARPTLTLRLLLRSLAKWLSLPSAKALTPTPMKRETLQLLQAI